MAWTGLLAMIMQILTFIFGIFNPPKSTVQTQYTCAAVRWSQAPKMVNGEFVGRVEQSCRFEGRSGGGLSQLKSHLVSQVAKDGAIYSVSQSNGGTVYSVSLDSAADGMPVQTYGNATLFADAKRLKHSFEQTAVYTSSDAKYVAGLKAEMEVTPSTKSHWYNMTAGETIRVKKPAFMSNSYFQNKLVSEIEAQMPEHVIDAMNDMASHL